MTIGSVLDEAWTLFTRFFLRFFLIALVVFAAINLIYALVVAAISSDNGGAAVALGTLGIATALIGASWLQGAFVYAVEDARDGVANASFSELVARVAPSLLPLLGASLLAGLGIAIGFLLLIVPGFILLTLWSVIAPVVVIEKRPVLESFGRSRALVRGYGWTVFFVVMITALLSAVASALLQAAFSALPEFLEILIGSTIAQAMVSPFGAIAIAILYFRLREAHGEPVAAAAPVEA